ncbi:MAG: HAD-IIIC family phosphatase [Bryobacteraceae bacterium]|nr:HAD-IIIC family phosphatase [Bryobacteraceae bacterium]
MKLLEALEITRKPAPEGAAPFRVFLGCGFTPLDLETYLKARLRTRMGMRPARVATGLFGDLCGSLERLAAADFDAAAVVVEWSDLDARLGYRALGGWRPDAVADVLKTSAASLNRLGAALKRLAAQVPVAVALPSLRPAPIFWTTPAQAGAFEWDLEAALLDAVRSWSRLPRLRVLSRAELDRVSPGGDRHDAKSDLNSGFPYRGAHASRLAELLAGLISPKPAKKGLISDLDDTLWLGILGETGVAGVHWDLENKAQVHGLYQQALSALAESGVLVAVASKNDPALVEQALSRTGLAIARSSLFPVEANWGPKSESVRKILASWNIGAGDVVFVDDSPMELAEVERAHPGIETILFPKSDPAAAITLLWTLRERFGKEAILEEDKLRSQSLRTPVEQVEVPGHGAALDEFLASAAGAITIDAANPPPDTRAFELVNKTNQFNINGRRFTEGEWNAMLQSPGAFLLTVSYQDRFGPLGRIAVLAGAREGSVCKVHTWVMSCRAFSRRIEHQCLAYLFDTLEVDRVDCDFRPTERNGPSADFFAAICGSRPEGPVSVSRQDFRDRCPAVYHKLEVLTHA